MFSTKYTILQKKEIGFEVIKITCVLSSGYTVRRLRKADSTRTTTAAHHFTKQQH